MGKRGRQNREKSEERKKTITMSKGVKVSLAVSDKGSYHQNWSDDSDSDASETID